MNKIKRISNLLGIITLVAIGLILWEISIYRLTFISWWVPVLIAIVTGGIMTFVLRGFMARVFPQHGFGILLPYNIVTWGGIAMFLFMWCNYQFAGDHYQKLNAHIVRMSRLASRNHVDKGQPYISILYQGREEHLLFDAGTDMDTCNSVDLTLAPGFFGYTVVVNKTLRPE